MPDNAEALKDGLSSLRVDAAKRGKWNVGYFAAGFVFWVYAAFIGITFDLHVARVYWLVGTFFIFPMAVAFSHLIGADPFTKENALGQLVGYTHMSVIALTFPLVIAAFFYKPEMLLLVMSIAYCIDFYVMTCFRFASFWYSRCCAYHRRYNHLVCISPTPLRRLTHSCSCLLSCNSELGPRTTKTVAFCT